MCEVAVQNVLIVAMIIGMAQPARPGINNDDSCDISVVPAATLLLPFF